MSSDRIDHEQMMDESIRRQIEENEDLLALRSELHVKILQLMRDQQNIPKSKLLTGANKTTRDFTLVKVINQLIMEFFDWFGYRHTLETFRMESGDDIPVRSKLEESLFTTPDSEDLPLLAQLVMREWKSSRVQVPVPGNPTVKRHLEDQRRAKDIREENLMEVNPRLLANVPSRKAITVKQMTSPPTQPPPIAKKVDRNVSVESSESDIFESDYTEETEDSDAYADIPDRHVFEDDLQPEGRYTFGQGEEGGPYDAKQSLAESQSQRGLNTDEMPSCSQEQRTPRGRKNEEIKSKVCSKNRPTLADEPETHITDIDLDSDDSCGDDDSL